MRLFRRRRKPWTHADVVDAPYPKFAVRTYLEHRDLRAYMAHVAEQITIRRACELGAGYGRMTMVLREFASEVVGFEREATLVAEGTEVLPDIQFINVATLGELPVETGSMDFAMTFTVLQHLRDHEVSAAVAEINRIVKPGGFVLLCEENDPTHVSSRRGIEDLTRQVTIGRTEDTYRQIMAPSTLVMSSPREIEPGNPRPNAGAYMLFRRP